MILLNKKAQKVSPECTSTQRGRRGEERWWQMFQTFRNNVLNKITCFKWL
jgi:hypothetical protein